MVNPGTFLGTRKAFLEANRPLYAKSVATDDVSECLADIQRRYFKRYPVDLPLDQEPSPESLEQVDDDAADEDEPSLPEKGDLDDDAFKVLQDEYMARGKLITQRKQQIARWFSYRYRKDNDAKLHPKKLSDNDAITILTAKITGLPLQKPRRRTAYNVWGPRNRHFVDPVFKERVQAGNVPKKQHAALRSSVYKELFQQLLQKEEQQEWEELSIEEHKNACDAIDAKLNAPPSTDPKDRQEILNRLPSFAQPILDIITEYTGWKATLMVGGPEPADNGRLNVISIHSGSTKGTVKQNFSQSERRPYKEYVVPVFAHFLKKCYTLDECRASALPEDSDGLSAMQSDSDINHDTLDWNKEYLQSIGPHIRITSSGISSSSRSSRSPTPESSSSRDSSPSPHSSTSPSPLSRSTSPPSDPEEVSGPKSKKNSHKKPRNPLTRSKPRVPSKLRTSSSSTTNTTLRSPSPSDMDDADDEPPSSGVTYKIGPPAPRPRPRPRPIPVTSVDAAPTLAASSDSLPSSTPEISSSAPLSPPPTLSAPPTPSAPPTDAPPTDAPPTAAPPSTLASSLTSAPLLPSTNTSATKMPQSPTDTELSNISGSHEKNGDSPEAQVARVHGHSSLNGETVTGTRHTGSSGGCEVNTNGEGEDRHSESDGVKEAGGVQGESLSSGGGMDEGGDGDAPTGSSGLPTDPVVSRPPSPIPSRETSPVDAEMSDASVVVDSTVEKTGSGQGCVVDAISRTSQAGRKQSFVHKPDNSNVIASAQAMANQSPGLETREEDPDHPSTVPLTVESPPARRSSRSNSKRIRTPSPDLLPAKRARSTTKQVSATSSTPPTSSRKAHRSRKAGTSPSKSSSSSLISASTPKYVSQATSLFSSAELGDQWKGLVDAWIAFEKSSNFVPNGSLKPTGRPICISDWIQRARSTTWRPDVSGKHLEDLEKGMMEWWRSLQPEGRIYKDGHGSRANTVDFQCLRRPGQNGLLSIMAGLFFLGDAIRREKQSGVRKARDVEAQRAVWAELVDDVAWVLTRLSEDV